MAGSWYSARGGSLSARRGGRRRTCICLTVSRSFRAGCAGQQLSRVIPPRGRPRARARRSPGQPPRRRAGGPSASARRPPGGGRRTLAIRLTQPRVPNRRTARLIAAATLSAAGAADRCSAEANSAWHHASSTFNRVLAVLPAVDVLAGEGTGSPGAGTPRRAKRTGNPPVIRTCVWMDVPDEVVTVSLLTSRLSCCCG
jgi:hypothetical protein